MAVPIDNVKLDGTKDNFKHVYKRYKRRDMPLDTSDVIDLSSDSYMEKYQVEPFELLEPNGMQTFPGLKPIRYWKAYQIKQCKGFIIVRNPFEPKYQRYWIQRCLLDFPKKPNRTNLDAHMTRPSQIWHHCLTDKPDLSKSSLLMRLRWATLGYQYEWNTKEYFADRIQSFPDDLRHLCSYIAAALGYSEYSCEAGIVNYYRMDSALMAHTDVSELDKVAPLISFSFGQSCIFLIGGPTKDTEPVPIFLNSGDICLMTEAARLSYHAVPRILPGKQEYLQQCFYGNSYDTAQDQTENNDDIEGIHHDSTKYIDFDSEDHYNENPPFVNLVQPEHCQTCDSENTVVTPTAKGDNCSIVELSSLMNSVISDSVWRPFQMYVDVSRINVNVRQVLKEGLALKTSPESIPTCQATKMS